MEKVTLGDNEINPCRWDYHKYAVKRRYYLCHLITYTTLEYIIQCLFFM